MRTFKLLLAIVILVMLLVFSAYNAQPVQIRFFGLQTGDLPLFLPIVFCFGLGFLAAALLATIRSSQLRRQVHQLERDLASARQGSAQGAGAAPASQQTRI